MGASKTAEEILEAVVEDGREELGRASAGLALSGFAAGLIISFSAVALAVVGSASGGVGLAAMLAYPVGFLLVTLGRAQLYTANTVTPVTVVLSRGSGMANLLRLWAVVFAANLVGTALFAATVVDGHLLEPGAMEVLLGEVAHKLGYGFGAVFMKGVFGGWLVALVVWMVAASKDTISQVFFVYVLVFLIPAAGFTHCVAGSAEVLMSVFSGETGFGRYLGGFLVPTTLGNTVGGVLLVTLLNYGQVVGSGKTTPLSAYTDDAQDAS